MMHQFDDDDYQAAYQQFMLGSAPSTPLDPPHSTLTTPSSALLSTPTSSSSKTSPLNDKYYSKSNRSLLKAFQGILSRDWLEIEQQLGNVLRSIANLRDRIFWSSQELSAGHPIQDDRSKPKMTTTPWKRQQRLKQHKIFLTKSDLILALSHEMQQHEKMMAGARSLLSNLHDSQESLGRRLEDATRESLFVWDDDTNRRLHEVVIYMEHAYHDLSTALYRHQVSVLKVLESGTHNSLLYHDNDNWKTDDDDDESPRRSAQQCWAKFTPASQLESVQAILDVHTV